jgi:hypothetical protein
LDQIDEKCKSRLINYAKAFYSKDLNHDFLVIFFNLQLRNLKFPEYSALQDKNYLGEKLFSISTESDRDNEKECEFFSTFLKHYEKFGGK